MHGLTIFNLIGGCVNLGVAAYLLGVVLQDIHIKCFSRRLVLLYIAGILTNLLIAAFNLLIVFAQTGH